jgi:hypothetical protein
VQAAEARGKPGDRPLLETAAVARTRGFDEPL